MTTSPLIPPFSRLPSPGPCVIASPRTPVLFSPIKGTGYTFGEISLGSGSSKRTYKAQAIRNTSELEHFRSLAGQNSSNGDSSSVLLQESVPNSSRSPTQRAISVIEISSDDHIAERQYNQIRQESRIIKLCKELNIPNIVRFESIDFVQESDPLTRKIFILSPLCEGGALNTLPRDQPELICKIFHAIAQTIRLLHSHQIVHWDIKPENILLRNGQPVLIDFGCSWVIGSDEFPIPKESEGTMTYRSPYPRGPNESPKSRDIFAFGATLYQILAGKSLAEDVCKIIAQRKELNPKNIDIKMMFLAQATDTLIREAILENIEDSHAQDLLIQMLFCNAQQFRSGSNSKDLWGQTHELTIEQVLAHPYFQASSHQSAN